MARITSERLPAAEIPFHGIRSAQSHDNCRLARYSLSQRFIGLSRSSSLARISLSGREWRRSRPVRLTRPTSPQLERQARSRLPVVPDLAVRVSPSRRPSSSVSLSKSSHHPASSRTCQNGSHTICLARLTGGGYGHRHDPMLARIIAQEVT